MYAMKKRWQPLGQTTHGKGHCSHGQGVADKGTVFDESAVTGSRFCLPGWCLVIGATTGRYAQQANWYSQQKPRQTDHQKSGMPAEPLPQYAAQDIAESAPHRDGQVKPGQNPATSLLGKVICHKSRRNRTEARFADPNCCTCNQKSSVAAGKTGQSRCQTPDHHSSRSKLES